jgi:hypothetical protein
MDSHFDVRIAGGQLHKELGGTEMNTENGEEREVNDAEPFGASEDRPPGEGNNDNDLLLESEPFAEYEGILKDDAEFVRGGQNDTTENGLEARSEELENRSLGKRNPLTACLGTINAQQIRAVHRMFDLFDAVMQTSPRNLETFERLAKPLAVLQALHRQIDRNVQTLERRKQERKKRNPPTLSPGPLRGLKLGGGPRAGHHS